MGSETTRATLLSRVRNSSDDDAWREFDALYRELILRYAMRNGLQVSDAEDVRQAVLVRLARSLRDFQYDPQMGSFRGYLRRCVRNEIASIRSRQVQRGATPLDTELDLSADESDSEHDEMWEAEWRAHHLRRALDKARKAFERPTIAAFERLLAGESPEAIALGAGSNAEAVQRSKRRVRDFLRARIEEQIAQEEFPERVGD